METTIIIIGFVAMVGCILGIIGYVDRLKENILIQKMKAEFDLEIDTLNKVLMEVIKEQERKEDK